jgi:hypothetical protein
MQWAEAMRNGRRPYGKRRFVKGCSVEVEAYITVIAITL